jgi:putative oxidoreductase
MSTNVRPEDGRRAHNAVSSLSLERRKQLGTAMPPGGELSPAPPPKASAMNAWIRWMLQPGAGAPKATVLIRLMAGWVFFWEGVIKFVFVNQGVGRFTKLGMPMPETLAPAIAVLEIVGGLALMAGFLTRPFALLFIGEMIVAILSTKISMYLGNSPLPLPPVPPQIGFWAVMHEWRSDIAQLACTLFLLLEGPGPWSVDAWLHSSAGHAPLSDRADTVASAARRQGTR